MMNDHCSEIDFVPLFYDIIQIEKWIKCRYILTILLTLGMMNAFIMRVNMSLAIVAMVDAPEVDKNDVHECRYLDVGGLNSEQKEAQNATRETNIRRKVRIADEIKLLMHVVIGANK